MNYTLFCAGVFLVLWLTSTEKYFNKPSCDLTYFSQAVGSWLCRLFKENFEQYILIMILWESKTHLQLLLTCKVCVGVGGTVTGYGLILSFRMLSCIVVWRDHLSPPWNVTDLARYLEDKEVSQLWAFYFQYLQAVLTLTLSIERKWWQAMFSGVCLFIHLCLFFVEFFAFVVYHVGRDAFPDANTHWASCIKLNMDKFICEWDESNGGLWVKGKFWDFF